MGPPASHWISRAPWYSGYSLLFLVFNYRVLTFCDWPSHAIRLTIHYVMRVLQPRIRKFGLGSSRFARRYYGNRFFFLFLRVLRCFSSPGYLLIDYIFTYGYLSITLSEFPHSEICGSQDMCSLPQLIAACHVLLRLLVPRHPPCALLHLTKSVT